MSLHFHHIGVACEDLDAESRRLAALNYEPEGVDFRDDIQGVSGRFLVGGGPRLELLKQTHDSGVLAPWLKARIKLYHLAYEADDFEAEIDRLRSGGAKVVVAAVPAIAFSARRIAFLMMPNLLLTELIER